MMKPRFNLWIEKDGQVVISRWRARLLEAIDQSGSISGAAEVLEVPYRTAWERVQEMEQGLGVKLVATEVGGSRGGGAHLTSQGRALLEQFTQFANGFDQEVEVRFSTSFSSLEA